MPGDVLAQFRAQIGSRALDAAASQARELREWFRRFVRKHAGEPLGPRVLHDLAPLNELLARDKAYRNARVFLPSYSRPMLWSLALDFLNSIAAPWDQEIEWLTTKCRLDLRTYAQE